jgi:lactoylglutathione lyase
LCSDIEASHARAVAAGAKDSGRVFAVGPVKVALLEAPEGHEIELVQLPVADAAPNR